MTSVNEEELRGAVLRVLRALLLPDLGEVPDVQPAVSAGAGEDGLVMGRPLDLERTGLLMKSNKLVFRSAECNS